MLKKLIFALMTVLAVTAGYAQETVYETPKVLDNIYVSATVGANTDATAFAENLYPELNVYIGKWFTPSVGIELNGEMDLWDSFKTRSCFVKQSYVGIAGIVDIANMFVGYNPARKVHVTPFVGIGWLHGYVNNNSATTSYAGPVRDTNDIATKMGINFGFDVAKNFAINVRPTIMYNLTANDYPKYNAGRALVGLEAGISYKFGGFKQKTVVPYVDYQNLMEEVNELRARQPEVQTVEVIKEVAVQTAAITVAEPEDVHVGFTVNSSNINYTQLPVIAAAAQYLNDNPDINVHVHGYADAGTGTADYNKALSQKRADAVKAALVNLGVDAARITTFGEGSGIQIYPENDWNRAAVIEFGN